MKRGKEEEVLEKVKEKMMGEEEKREGKWPTSDIPLFTGSCFSDLCLHWLAA